MTSLSKQIANLFATPSAEVLAVRELENTKRELLAAQTALESYTFHVQCLIERKKRLEKTVGAQQ